MKVVVDRDVCIGSGMCALHHPELFDQDRDDGRVVLLHPAVGEERRAEVVDAAYNCPSGAITVVDE